MANPSVEILDVTFLTPALICMKIDGEERFVQASIDIVNRKVYINDRETFSEEVFNYLDVVNTLPEDFYAAPSDVLEKAAEAWADQDKLKQQHAEG